MNELSALSTPSKDLAGKLRADVLRSAFGPEVPPYEVQSRLIAWSRAAAPNTIRAIASDLKIVAAFQEARYQPSLPLPAINLYLLIEERSRAGIKKSSIDRLVASMLRLHQLLDMPSPVDENVRWKMKEIRKRDTRAKGQALGLRLKGEVADIHEDDPAPVSILGLLRSIPEDAAGLRDRALISIGYDAGLRRSEIVRIRHEHIEHLPSGEASLFLPRSKTDQEGEGARAWVSARTVEHLKHWMEFVDIHDGYVFLPLSYRVSAAGHISEGAVSKILKQRLRAYLEDLPEEVAIERSQIDKIVSATSAHSLRVGADQDLFAAGVDIGAIMQGLRWSNPKQPLSYARHLAPATSKLAATMRRIRS